MAGDDRAAGAAAEVPELAWLRRLVAGLAVVMGIGILAIAAILWLRLSEPPLPRLPDTIRLPAGVDPVALTFARDWTVVVGASGELLLYDRDGTLRQQLAVD